MELFCQKVERVELNPGDHIYTWRKQIYSHHGIFTGEGKIIHFVNLKSDKLTPFSAPLRSSSGGSKKKKKTPCSYSYCGLAKIDGSAVRLSCINCFIKKGSLYLFKYNASREFLLAKLRGGTCTTARSDPPEEVIKRANYFLENGYEEYDLLNNNCEDFALYCKTGLWSTNKHQQGRSSQANMVLGTNPAIGDFAFGELWQQLSLAIPKYFLRREHTDLGIREDVVKVSVEDLSSFLRTLK